MYRLYSWNKTRGENPVFTKPLPLEQPKTRGYKTISNCARSTGYIEQLLETIPNKTNSYTQAARSRGWETFTNMILGYKGDIG